MIEKTATSDVYLFDARYAQRERELFDPPEPGPESYVLGADRPAAVSEEAPEP